MLAPVVMLLFLFNLNGSSRIVLHVNNTPSTETIGCELWLKLSIGAINKIELFKFEANGFLVYSIEIENDANDLYIVSKQCISLKLYKIVILNEEYIMDYHCRSNVYRNLSKLCVNNLNSRSLLSLNATNDDYDNINDDDIFLGRRFYGLPILVYFALLFGVVCIVWVCCIIALCIGYSKRRKAIKAKGVSIRRKELTKTITKSKQINSLSPTPNSRSIKTINKNRGTKRSPRPNIILPIPPQREQKRQIQPPIIHKSVSYPSDNDIIQQMEQDWASENGTNIFDSPIAINSLHLINSQFNSADTNDTNKNIPIIYALNSRNIYNKDNYYYGKRPHTTRPNQYNEYDNERSRRTQSDTSIYSKSSSNNNKYNTNNNKNPFYRRRHHMSLEEQIEMKHNRTNEYTLKPPDLDQQMIEIDYGEYSNPISLPQHEIIKHKHLSKDDSIRFPKESMPFNDERERERGRQRGIQITIQKAPFIDYKQSSLQEPAVSGALSPISNTPQPVSAPLSPKALSNTMPIRPLSQAKKSPFHLPPPSISLQRIHSPEPHINQIATSPSKSNSTNKKHKEILHHYSLDQTDLFEKLTKIEHYEDVTDIP